MTVSARAKALVIELQRELGVSIECGHLTCNINQRVCRTIHVGHQFREGRADKANDLDTTGRSA